MNSRVAKSLIVAAISLLALSGCAGVVGTGAEHIDSLAVEYTIEPGGTVHAVERIDYDFGSEQGKHGIDRFLASRFADGDGTERVYRYSNVSVTSPSGASALFSTTLSNALQIRIGNKNATVGGKQSYVIGYDIAGALNSPASNDPASNGTGAIDELYWNVTGNYWTVPIDKTTVEVRGPAASTQLACYSGTLSSSAHCARTESDGTGAHFSEGKLFPGEGLTIDIAWPGGTFANTAPIIEQPLAPGAVVTSGSNDGPDPFWSPWNWGTGLVLLAGIPALFWLLVVLRNLFKQAHEREQKGEKIDLAALQAEAAKKQPVVEERKLTPAEIEARRRHGGVRVNLPIPDRGDKKPVAAGLSDKQKSQLSQLEGLRGILSEEEYQAARRRIMGG